MKQHCAQRYPTSTTLMQLLHKIFDIYSTASVMQCLWDDQLGVLSKAMLQTHLAGYIALRLFTQLFWTCLKDSGLWHLH